MASSLYPKFKALYTNGWSTRAISTEYHTKNNSIIRYLQAYNFSKKSLGYIKSYERKRRIFLNMDKVSLDKIDKNEAKIFAALLYWCEGSKYPASTNLSFTSSDTKMLQLFLSLFRKGFNPIESKFRIWLQIHSDQNKQKIFRYWSDVLRIPESQFIKPKITVKKGGRYRRVYYGTCSLRYGDYSMILRLTGIYQRFYIQALSALV